MTSTATPSAAAVAELVEARKPRSSLLSLSTEWPTATEVRITASGEVDASNAVELAAYVFRHAANSRRMILDLSHLEFFGTAGFSALWNIHAGCAQAQVAWTVVAGRPVSRVLEICDRHGALPIAV
jgi:anti-anti-sigma factor